MRFGMMAAAAAALLCAGQASAQNFVLISEIEPNDTLTTAQAVPLTITNPLRISGSLEGTSNDFVDYFSFTTGPLACASPQSGCYSIFVSTDGVGATAPVVGLFDQSGFNYFNFGNPTSGSLQVVKANQSFTAAIRRSSLSTPSSYNLFLTLTYAYAPEPATWAMMILGVAAVGASVRRRRSRELATA